jgi:hypothetical protein
MTPAAGDHQGLLPKKLPRIDPVARDTDEVAGPQPLVSGRSLERVSSEPQHTQSIG